GAPDEDQSGPWLWTLDVDRKVTHRLSGGLERYLSVAATADGRRLVASVANPTATLWIVPSLDRVVGERHVRPYPVGPSRALGPRFGKGPVFFLSSSGAKDGLWSYADGKALEIWKGVDGELSAPAAVSPDGDQVAVAPIRNGRRTLTIVSATGVSHLTLSDRVDVRGASA